MDSTDGDLIGLDHALRVIGEDNLRLLSDCRQVGWSRWEAVRASSEGPDLTPRARASIVHDSTVAHARRVFPSVMCGQRHGFLVLDMKEVAVRFKKLDENLAPSGIPTGQAVLFEEQRQVDGAQLKIWPSAPMLIAGYVLDKLGTSIARMVLILRHRGEVIWEHELGKVQIPVIPVSTTEPEGMVPATAAVRSTRKQTKLEDGKEAE